MKYPYLSELRTSRKMIDVFGGYNHNLRIGDGEFYDMTNLSSADYPVLSPRHARGFISRPTAPQGMIAKDILCHVHVADPSRRYPGAEDKDYIIAVANALKAAGYNKRVTVECGFEDFVKEASLAQNFLREIF